jgi:hypothetical protein
VNVLDNAALAGLFGQGPPPFAVVNTWSMPATFEPRQESTAAIDIGQDRRLLQSSSMLFLLETRETCPEFIDGVTLLIQFGHLTRMLTTGLATNPAAAPV